LRYRLLQLPEAFCRTVCHVLLRTLAANHAGFTGPNKVLRFPPPAVEVTLQFRRPLTSKKGKPSIALIATLRGLTRLPLVISSLAQTSYGRSAFSFIFLERPWCLLARTMVLHCIDFFLTCTTSMHNEHTHKRWNHRYRMQPRVTTRKHVKARADVQLSGLI